MATQNNLRVSEELLAELQSKAQAEGKPLDEIVEEAVRKGLEEPSWEDLMAYGRERASASGHLDADIPRLVKEWRREQRSG